MKTILYIIMSLHVIITCSCQDKKDFNLELQPKVFISQPLVNRTADDELSHDENCTGFLTNHFEPEDLLMFMENITVERLDSLTGINWNTVAAPDSILDFLTEFTSDDDTNRVAYVYEIIRANKEINKVISIGSDDGIKVWFNGGLVLTDHRGRQIQAHDNLVPVRFNKGFNYILYKVDQGGGQWELYRKIISINDKNNILSGNVAKHYGGMPVSSIISDTTVKLDLDIKYNSTVDSLHSVSFKWLNVLSKELLSTEKTFLACNLPAYISIPNVLKNWSILQVDVMDNNSNTLVFREEIPVAYKSFADSLAVALTSNAYSVSSKTIFEARKDAVIQLFNLYDAGNEWEYSTRMQLHALLDLYLCVNVSLEIDLTYAGPRNFGYILETDSSMQPYRLIMPANMTDNYTAQKSYNLVYCPRWRIRRDIGFWEVYQARSHSVNIRRANLSTLSNSILIVPYSHVELEKNGSLIQEFIQITDQVKSMLNINSENISMFMYSSSAGEVLPQLINEPIPLANMGLMNCILPTDKNAVRNIINRLHAIYPDINWLIWHGVQDEEAPVEMTRFLVEHLSSLTEKVSYREEYYSTHIQYFGDPEKEFLLKISGKN